MGCIFCGAWFVNSGGSKACSACERAMKRLQLHMAPEHLQEIANAFDRLPESDTVIKTLQAERDAAVEDLKKISEDTGDGCHLCKHLPCAQRHGRCIGWEWRGPQKEGAG